MDPELEKHAAELVELVASGEGTATTSEFFLPHTSAACPDAPHRGPQGPNEDLSQCPRCLSPSWSLRPPGQTYGVHLADCSLPERHSSYCKPGGAGHPVAKTVRGYFPSRPGRD